LLRTKTVPEFAELFPGRFNNKTNGVTPRRWLMLANPDLAKLLTEAIGERWVTDLSLLRKVDPLAKDAGFQKKFLEARRSAKARLAVWIARTAGITLDPDTLFDIQIKRIHEYKRQLLNAIQCVVWYNRLRQNPKFDVPPRTVLFAGKAAPAYRLAKLMIKLITSIGRVVNADPVVRGRLRVEFLPNYSCTLAEHLIPAADVSEQISTAGYEASGTSNMKFMMNGALTVGTRDGANIEIAEEAGEENVFMFGLTADQVLSGRGWYNPRWHYDNEPETRTALDLIFNNHFSPDEPGIFEPIRETLLERGDYYMHLADLSGYMQTQEKVAALYGEHKAWAQKAIHNIARSGKFSSDRTIEEYASEIWGAEPCPVD
jgi:starch phosphorylase